MKRNPTIFLVVFSIAILFGIGSAWAGGRSHYSHHPNASYYKGYKHHGNGWGYRHHAPPDRYHHHRGYGPRYYNYRYYGPPAYYHYYNSYYPGAWGGYDGAYYFSGGFSEPGFGFAFGTRGNW
jgi:hypothetical protein